MTPIGFDKAMNASQWLTLVKAPYGPLRRILRENYGNDTDIHRERLQLFHSAVQTYLEQYGDGLVRLFRSPGRINLRGMHVDTHGGCLNLMTHHREVVLAIGTSSSESCFFSNIDPSLEPVEWDIGSPPQTLDWNRFINEPAVIAAVRAQPGHWKHYLQGCLQRVQRLRPEQRIMAIQGVFGGDLPQGAALSSSAALCMVFVTALDAVNELGLTFSERILAARDAEWYAGARVGVSDQGAMALGRFNKLISVALDAARLDEAVPRYVDFPDDLAVIVIHSHTQRSLSGRHAIDYARNRFAYSIALDVVRQVMSERGWPSTQVASLCGLADLAPRSNGPIRDGNTLYELLLAIPETMTIDDLRERYRLPTFELAWEQYLGSIPDGECPWTIQLRGPLIFGIAESERARLFPKAIEQGQYKEAGRLMTVGHDGDRRVNSHGEPFHVDLSDAAIENLRAEGAPIHDCPGAYGASSPALDRLVDAALDGGALGASLTGAGIAGSVLALCHAERINTVTQNVEQLLSSPEYAAIVGLDRPLDLQSARRSIVVNQAPAGAGEFSDCLS